METVVIDRKRIAQSPSRRLDQILTAVPGVQLYRRSDSSSGHPTSQGITLRALGGNASSRALLVLDGVPQTDPFGGWVDWPAYDPADIQSIRVVRGGGSVADGPGALAGTISMSSRSDLGISGDLAAGSRNSIDADGRAGFALGGGIASLSARASRSDGFIPITPETRGLADRPAPFTNRGGRARWVAPIGASVEVQANASAFHDFRTRGTDFSANRTNGADGSLRLVGRGEFQWSALGYWQWRNFQSQFASVAAGRGTAKPAAEQYSVPSHGHRRKDRGQAADARRRRASDRRRWPPDQRRNPGILPVHRRHARRQRFAGGETWTLGAFSRSQHGPRPRHATAGGRIDRWHIGDGHLFERDIATGTALTDVDYPDARGWQPTGRAGHGVARGAA